MWNVPIAAIPGAWPALPAVPPWLAGAAAGAVLLGLGVVLAGAARLTRLRERRARPGVRRLHGVRAA